MTFSAFSYGAEPGANGGGVLARLTFRPEATGTTVLGLSHSPVTDSAGETQEGLAANQALLELQEPAATSFVPMIRR